MSRTTSRLRPSNFQEVRNRWAATGGIALFAISTIGFLGGTYFGLNRPKSFASVEASNPLSNLLFGLAIVAFSAVGALILVKKPGQKLGWTFATVGFFGSMSSIGFEYAIRGMFGDEKLPLGPEIGWLGSWTWMGIMFGIVLTLLLFPTGHLLSRRWLVVPVLIGTAWGMNIVAAISVWDLRGPALIGDVVLGAPPIYRVLTNGVYPLVGISIILGAASLIVRFRRSTGETRQQIKWIALAGLLLASVIIVGGIEESVFHLLPEWVFDDMAPLALIFIPVAAGIAILKYRLYDIDVVINKTVVYGGLAGFITAVYVGIVVGIGTVVGAGDKPNLALSLLATAFVAVAFQPVRERVQRFANKLVYGERITPYEAITGFSHRMAESLSLDSVLPQMAEAAAKGVGGVRSRVTLILPGGGERVVNWPEDSTANSFERTLAVVHQGDQMGEISVSKSPGEQINKNEDKLLSDLASQAGLAMRNLRLTAELRQKLVELQASRQRIVKAQDEERRRMERDIHDGAQQQLVSMSVKLGLVGNLLSRDVQRAGAILEELRVEAGEAVETLRDLARGLFPEILTEQGLKSALLAHIAKMDLKARVDGEIGRFNLELEANVYFCIREALQNASKHAPGAPLVITLEDKDRELSFTVKDEGQGFDVSVVKLGSGLQNMRDRVEALGGDFQIRSSPGVGTSVEAKVPAAVRKIV